MNSKVTGFVKDALKRKRKEVRLALLRTYRSFGRAELLDALKQLGICAGDSLFVHSSLDQFAAFTGKPTDINATLLEAVGDGGHVLMPTIPFSGTAVEHVASGRDFDVRRTASRVGLLTELFRRSSGVTRSVHPTHPVAVAGPASDVWISGHHLTRTPCGKGSPYARLAEKGAKILFMGTDIGVMTFFHFVEEELEPQMPFSPFTKETYTLRSKDWDGKEVVTCTRLFDPVYSRARNLDKLTPHLKLRGFWFENKVGGVKLSLVKANDVLSTCRDLARQGIYCYD